METPEELSDITDWDGRSQTRTESGWTTYLVSSMHDDGDTDSKSSLASDASTGNIHTDKTRHYHDNYYDDGGDEDDVDHGNKTYDNQKGKVEKSTEKNTEKKWFRGLFKKDGSSSKDGSKNKKANIECGRGFG